MPLPNAMFHIPFLNEKDALAYLDSNQQRRVLHVRDSHRSMKELNLAVSDAIRCHERYLDSLDKVMHCLAAQSDMCEDARSRLGECAASFLPTKAASDHLVTAYSSWKASDELRALLRELQALQRLTESGKEITKRNKTNVENYEKCVIRCEAVNAPEHQAKISQRSGKAKEKLEEEQRELNQRLTTLEASVQQDIGSTGSWWSEKLIAVSDSIYRAFAQLGHRTVASFPSSRQRERSVPAAAFSLVQQQRQLARPRSTQSLQNHGRSRSTSTSGGAPLPMAAAVEDPYTHGGYIADGAVADDEGAHQDLNTTVGVPLEFQTSQVNAQRGKSLE